MEDASSSQRIGGSFVRSRVGSLVAVLPLGVWTMVHLWNNLAAFQGGAAWEDAVTRSHPLAHFLTLLVVMIPLVLHTIWGLSRLRTARPNNVRYGFFHNLKYVVQRVSAVGVMLFLGAHVWKAMLHPRYVEGHPESFADIATQMAHHVPTLVVYALGTLGVAYHLSNGLTTFAMGWGIVSSRRALRKLELLGWLLFAILLVMSWGTLFAMWRAGQ